MATWFLVARTAHFVGIVLWLTGLFATGWFLGFRDREGEAGLKTRLGQTARRLGVVADAGATLAIAGGIYMALQLHAFVQPWLHIKLALVAVVLAVHIMVRIKAKKASRGEGAFPRALTRILFVAMVAIIYMVVFKPIVHS